MTAELEKTRELEAQLQQAEKSAVVGRLASAIAHEIRNPLNYINLTLDHLRAKFIPEETEERENFEKLTSQLKTEVERINRQISEFLHYSRPVKLDLQPIEIRKVIDASLRLVEVQAEDQNIKISVVERENCRKFWATRKFCVLFLIIYFSMPPKRWKTRAEILNVILSTFDEYVKIEIKDTGEGIRRKIWTKSSSRIFQQKIRERVWVWRSSKKSLTTTMDLLKWNRKKMSEQLLLLDCRKQGNG